MKSGKKLSLKAGDLITMADGSTQVALVLCPAWDGPDNEIQTWTVLWSDHDGPVEMDAIALQKGWVTLVNRP